MSFEGMKAQAQLVRMAGHLPSDAADLIDRMLGRLEEQEAALGVKKRVRKQSITILTGRYEHLLKKIVARDREKQCSDYEKAEASALRNVLDAVLVLPPPEWKGSSL